MKKLKEIIKKYFLFMAAISNYFLISVGCAHFFSWCFAVIILLCFLPEGGFFDYYYSYSVIITVIFLVNYLINKKIIKKYITIFSVFSDSSILVLPNNKLIDPISRSGFLKNVYWGKGIIYYLNFYELKQYPSADSNITEVVVEVGLWVNYNIFVVVVPISISLFINKKLDLINIYEVVKNDNEFVDNDANPYIIDIRHFLIYILAKENKSKKEVMEIEVKKYCDMEIRENELRTNIAELLTFPEKLFSNIEKINFSVGSPRALINSARETQAAKEFPEELFK